MLQILEKLYEIDPVLIEQIQYSYYQKKGEIQEEQTLEEEIMNLQGQSLSNIAEKVHELCVKLDRDVKDRVTKFIFDKNSND